MILIFTGHHSDLNFRI